VKKMGKLEGFASTATGGCGGSTYKVTSNQDYDLHEREIPGSLRFGIERFANEKTPVTIEFDLKASKKEIILKRTLKLKSNLTINGGGKVTLAFNTDWTRYKIDENSLSYFRAQCAIEINPETGKRWDANTFISIDRKSNVIISGLTFNRLGYDEHPWKFEHPNLDKECLGDVISIFHGKKGNGLVDRIWINGNFFQACGDGCIDIVRGDQRYKSNISISKNKFFKADKTMLAGSPYDAFAEEKDPKTRGLKGNIPQGTYPYRISIYENTFQETTQRNPSASFVVLHVFRNNYINWGSYIVNSQGALVFFEENKLTHVQKGRKIVQTNSSNVHLYNNSLNEGAVNSKLEDTPDYQSLFAKWIRSTNTPSSSTGPSSLSSIDSSIGNFYEIRWQQSLSGPR
jgi:pectate lyase